MKVRVIVITHYHRYGHTLYVIKSNKSIIWLKKHIDLVCKRLGIEYPPHRDDESLSIKEEEVQFVEFP